MNDYFKTTTQTMSTLCVYENPFALGNQLVATREKQLEALLGASDGDDDDSSSPPPSDIDDIEPNDVIIINSKSGSGGKRRHNRQLDLGRLDSVITNFSHDPQREQLSKLKLPVLSLLNKSILGSILHTWPNLQKLDLTLCVLDFNALETLKQFTRLKILNCQGIQYTNESHFYQNTTTFENDGVPPQLMNGFYPDFDDEEDDDEEGEELDFLGFNKLQRKQIILDNKQLQKIETLWDSALSSMPMLESINFSETLICPRISAVNSHLKKVRLEKCKTFFDEHLEAICKFLSPTLRHLDIAGCEQIERFEPIAQCRQLRDLYLNDTKIRDADLARICTGCPEICDLKLGQLSSKSRLKDFKPLNQLKNLQKLAVISDPYHFLKYFTAETLKSIGACGSIKSILLIGINIGMSEFVDFARLNPNLEDIKLLFMNRFVIGDLKDLLRVTHRLRKICISIDYLNDEMLESLLLMTSSSSPPPPSKLEQIALYEILPNSSMSDISRETWMKICDFRSSSKKSGVIGDPPILTLIIASHHELKLSYRLRMRLQQEARVKIIGVKESEMESELAALRGEGNGGTDGNDLANPFAKVSPSSSFEENLNYLKSGGDPKKKKSVNKKVGQLALADALDSLNSNQSTSASGGPQSKMSAGSRRPFDSLHDDLSWMRGSDGRSRLKFFDDVVDHNLPSTSSEIGGTLFEWMQKEKDNRARGGGSGVGGRGGGKKKRNKGGNGGAQLDADEEEIRLIEALLRDEDFGLAHPPPPPPRRSVDSGCSTGRSNGGGTSGTSGTTSGTKKGGAVSNVAQNVLNLSEHVVNCGGSQIINGDDVVEEIGVDVIQQQPDKESTPGGSNGGKKNSGGNNNSNNNVKRNKAIGRKNKRSR